MFGADGVEVKAVPAGRIPENIGHHDLLINEDAVADGTPIPADKQHIHFDHGETRGEVSLPPGNYTLTLQFADGLERSHGPDMLGVLPTAGDGRRRERRAVAHECAAREGDGIARLG